MKTALTKAAAALAMFHLLIPAAIGAEKLPGQVALVSASSGCPAAAIDQAMVAVKLVLPATADGAARPVNRFRYNYMDTTVRPVISGEIRDFAAPGCTVSFLGSGLDYD